MSGASPSSRAMVTAVLLCVVIAAASACRGGEGGFAGFGEVRPRTLADVPAERLAFRFEPDVAEESLPERLRRDELNEPLSAIRSDFETRRGNTEALIRTVVDPTGQRALALYGTSETDTDFRIDLYSVDGGFIRNILPNDLTGVFPSEVAWSPSGNQIVFSGVRNPALAESPAAGAPIAPTVPGAPPGVAAQPPAAEGQAAGAQPAPTTSAPLIAPVQTFRTEQVYVANRDGFDLKPLTSREGLIYFQLAWSPDGQSVAALAAREDEWEARRNEGKLPAGRPRIITLDGRERLLDDRQTPVAPVFSPDGSKVATAFDYDLAIYDAHASAPTAGGLPLQQPLREASAAYDARLFDGNRNAATTPEKDDSRGGAQSPNPSAQKKGASEPGANASEAQPTAEPVLISMNPIIRLEWLEPETLYAQTAFVRFYRDEPLPTFKYSRWHALRLFPQAVVLTSLDRRATERAVRL